MVVLVVMILNSGGQCFFGPEARLENNFKLVSGLLNTRGGDNSDGRGSYSGLCILLRATGTLPMSSPLELSQMHLIPEVVAELSVT